jgi:thiosulfate dehydrogenase [quinone] large subunit
VSILVANSHARSVRGDPEIAYALLRVIFGTNIFLHGVARLIAGHAAFFAYISKQMASAPLPSWILPPFTYALPWLEGLIGLLILIGLFTRPALIGGVAIMLILEIGTCLAQNWQVAGDQLIYVAIYCALIAFVSHNRWSLDDFRTSSR